MAFNITPASVLSGIDFGIDVLRGISQVDIVGIYDQESLQQVFEQARPLKASVRESSQVMNYPVESGAILSDHHIINPVRIEIPLFIRAENYASTYQQIRGAFLNADSLAVQTRTGVYSNMIVEDMPHEEEPDIFNGIVLSLRLREVLLTVPSVDRQPGNYSPVNPANENTLNRGYQVASEVLAQISALAGYINAINVFRKRF